MPDVDTALAANREATRELIAAAEQCGAAWTTPRAPGKWSPSQIVEHVAIVLEDSANIVLEIPSKFPKLPAVVRPLLRHFFFNRVLKKGTFPNTRTIKALDPLSGPSTPAAGRVRLETAVVKFEEACRVRAALRQPINTTSFGAVSVADFARFQELHTRHHLKQMPSAR
jgi:hypothetical protein